MRTRIKVLITTLLIIGIAAIAWAGTISQQPYGVSTPYWYGYSSGSPAGYYLAAPTLSANDTACGIAATQTLTNKTLTSPTVSTPAITGGAITDGTLLDFAPTEYTASGAISANISYAELNSSGAAIAMTIAAPAAGRFLVITQTDAGTEGHTVTLTAGTYNGSNTIATFNAAAETLVLMGLSATRFVIVENIGSVALSGP